MSLHPVFQGICEAHGLQRLVRAADNVAGAETDSPNYDAFAAELQEAIEPFRKLISLPLVGQIVHYYNPAYAPSDNEHTGVGPYAALVTRAWEYGNSVLCNLKVVTPGKEVLADIGSVPERGSEMDRADYPCWSRFGAISSASELYDASYALLEAYNEGANAQTLAPFVIKLGRALRRERGEAA